MMSFSCENDTTSLRAERISSEKPPSAWLASNFLNWAVFELFPKRIMNTMMIGMYAMQTRAKIGALANEMANPPRKVPVACSSYA